MKRGPSKAVQDVLRIIAKDRLTALQISEIRCRTLASTYGLLQRMKSEGMIRIAGYAKDHRTYENCTPPFIWGIGNKPDAVYQKKPRDKVESDRYMRYRAIIIARKRANSGNYKPNIWSALMN